MLARLTVHFPFQPTRSFLVRSDGESLIGREPDCHIVLDDDRVSRRHARLAFAEGDWRLTDLGSTNGTALEGRPIRDAALGNDGWISFGGLLARFERTTAEREQSASRRREERYRSSISLQRQLTPSLGLEQLLERVLRSVLELSGAERGVVLLAREDGAMEIAARRDLSDPDLASERFSGSVGAIERVMTTARPVAVSDALADPFLHDRESVVAGRIRALVGLPLIAIDRLIGLIYADSRVAGASFDELDVEILEALASHAALAIVMARVDRELKGLAARLPAAGIQDLAGLAGLPAKRARDVGSASTWAGVVAHHRARTREGS
ncbi:MAG TPA: GAF domain-containing protein [Candidatus Polarisedimenticolaceae bacterium]|nr:GAF domain-containing protein [Candidatus Polarisedimenticolaceae bacterium]